MLKQIEPKRVTIGDVKFAIYPFPAFKAAGISGDLGKFIGPLIAGILPFLDGDLDKLLNEDLSKSLPVITQALNTLDSNSVEHILMELLVNNRNISCEYKDDNGRTVQEELTKELADDLFIGKMADMIRLAVEVAKLNYGSFFTGATTQSGSLGSDLRKSAMKIMENSTEAERIL